MVILLHCEMDDDGRRSKKSGLFKWMTRGSRPSPPGPHRRTSHLSGRELFPPTERRPLRSVPLVGPHYRVEPEILVTGFVEKETKFLGTVSDLDCTFDATDRASLLKIVDEQQTLDLLPCHLSCEHDIIVSFSVHNIKLLRRDGEKMIQRIQTHKIAAVGYVRDDNRHLVFIKFASELNLKMCNLAILCCPTKTAAEEVCSLAQQVFQLVYTDSTIDFLNKSIMDGAATPKNHSYSTDDSDKKDSVTVSSSDYNRYSLHKSADSLVLPTTSQSANGHSVLQPNASKRLSAGPFLDMSAGSSSTLPQPIRRPRRHQRSGSSGSSSNNNIAAASASAATLTSPATPQAFPVHRELQLHNYITVLKEQLTNVELKEFALLLHQFRTGVILIQEFSNKLLQMYTEERKHLLLGMRHFMLNASNLSFFNKFLKDNKVEDLPGSESTSWWAQAPRTTSRTLSETEDSTASASATTGNITAVSLSSSGSERASTSVVSNDDSGEWKDVIGDIKKLGIYASTDSSGGADLDDKRKPVNGTPPKPGAGILDLEPPVLAEETIVKAYVPPVAAVPEGFQDIKERLDKNITHGEPQASSFSKMHKSPSRAAEDSKEQRKSKSETSSPVLPESDPNQGPPDPPSSKTTIASRDSSSPGTHQETSKSNKPEHRKKKKHKSGGGSIAML